MLTVKVSSKGQIAIPKSIREQIDLKEGNELTISIQNKRLLMEKVTKSSWHKWRGSLKGTNALSELEKEHAKEVSDENI